MKGLSDNLRKGSKMKKRIGMFFAAAMAAIGAWTGFAATENVDGIDWTYDVVNGAARIYAGNKVAAIPPDTAGDITVPSELGGYTVSRIGSWAFYGCHNLTSVFLPSGVERIEDNAFYNCSIEELDISYGVTSIGANAFFQTGLERVWLPNSVESIGTAAFASCTSLRDVEITGSLTAIPPQLFNGCSALEILKFPDSVTTIGAQAFKKCTSLTEFSLPDGIASIGNDAFADSGLKAVYVSEGKTAAAKKAGLKPESGGFKILEVGERITCTEGGFDWTYRPIGEAGGVQEAEILGVDIPPVGGLTIPSKIAGLSVTRIGSWAFSYCETLSSVTIPSTVTRIDECAFIGCTFLETVNLPSGLTFLGDNAFSECDGLKSITIPSRLATIGAYSFYSCDALATVTIGAGVKRIGSGAFYDCGAMKSIVIPDSVTTIGSSAFSFCINLGSVKIGAGVTSIDESAFSECDKLKSIVIPDGVTKVKDNAFYGCDILESVKIGGGVTRIGISAFSSCPTLKSVDISGGVKLIGNCAFFGCAALKTVTFKGDLPICDGTGLYDETSEDLVTYVPAGNSTWADALAAGTWQYRAIRASGAATYKVTFGKNGGTGGDSYVTATYGAAMPTPRTAPKLSGWTFAGYWDTLALDEKGKQYYDASMKSVRAWDKTSATTLWAKWTNKVTLGKNGGTGGDSYVTCTKGQPMPKRTMPTKSGYVFDGYWTSTGAGGVKYYNADGTSAHAWDKSGSVTLWAKWVAAVSVKVTFGKNGGTGGDNYVTATTGKAMPTPRTAPKLSGWTFGGYWDTLACDAKGNPLGKQYYNSKMESVRNWDKTAATTLWAKWTVKVTLGKNGGTGGDSTVTVIKGQPFPKRTMPTKSGYKFGGYFVSASSKTGQCYNPDGTGTASMKWSTGGTPTIWALWTKTSACVELPAPVAIRAASAAPTAAPAVPAGLYSGVLADGTGAFWLMLDEPEEGSGRTAYLYVASEDGTMAAECTAQEAGGVLLLTTDDGAVYAFDPEAGTLGFAMGAP